MTVSAAVYTPEGFVIGADSLRRFTNLELPVDGAQKIFFATPQAGWVFSYAWTGTVCLELSLDSFSFIDAAKEALAELKNLQISDPGHFFEEFSNCIFRDLLFYFCGSLPAGGRPPTGLLAKVLFVGYAAGRPLQEEICFSHDDGLLQKPVRICFNSPDALGVFRVFSGSTDVFSKLCLSEPASLQEGIDIVSKYVQTCIDGKDSHPECSDFGGSPQIATITPKENAWIRTPKLID